MDEVPGTAALLQLVPEAAAGAIYLNLQPKQSAAVATVPMLQLQAFLQSVLSAYRAYATIRQKNLLL